MTRGSLGSTRSTLSVWGARLAALAIGPLLIIGLCEALAWAFGVAPQSESKGYAAWHEAQVCHFGGDPEGFCTRPPVAGSEDRAVVAVLGGSSVWGYPKGMKRFAFPNLMRSMLEQAAPGAFAVRNYGLFCKDSIFVRRCAETLIESGEPSVLVIYSGHNDFLNFMRWPGPRAMMFLEDNGWLIDARDWLAGTRTYSFLLQLREGEESTQWNRLPSPEFEEAFEIVLDAYTANIESIIEHAAARGIEVVLVTLASNISESPYPRDEWDAGLVEGRNPPEWDDWHAHFARGVELARAASYADAHKSFVRARDLLPMGRAPSQLNARIRDLARQYPQIHLVDFEREIDALGASESIGCEFFGDRTSGVDWCDPFHPSARTHRLIAESISRAILGLESDSTGFIQH